jgi:P-type Cu+ transporter
MTAVAQPSASLKRLAVSGMTCAGCVTAVSRVLSRVPGAAHVEVTLETGRAEIGGTATLDALLSALRKAGYHAEPLAS